MARVQIIGFGNGVGTTRDVEILGELLGRLGYEITIAEPSRYARRRRRLRLVRFVCALRRRHGIRRFARGSGPEFDVNIMLEHVWPEELHRAARNIIVPNPEFFDRHDRAWLASLDQVWAKTEHALGIFAARSACPVIKTGFDGRDRNDASIPRERHFLHLAGKSRMKGTSRLIDVWTRHPRWPTLTVVVSPGRRIPLIRAANLHYIEAFLGDAELSKLQNRHQFHVCVSEAEGWGHSLVEAQSAGAIVLATDTPPMNEHVSADSGLLILAHACARQHLALRHAFDEQDFGRAVIEALAMDAEQLRRRGTAARERFMSHRDSFAAGVIRALQALRL